MTERSNPLDFEALSMDTSAGAAFAPDNTRMVPDAVTVPFIGYRADGSTVTTSFTTDGVIDGPAGARDFQTFRFGPEFTGLSRVEIPTYGWSLDNVVFSVPERSAAALLLLGGGMLWVRACKRHARRR